MENIHPLIAADISIVLVVQHSSALLVLIVLVAKKKIAGDKVKSGKNQLYQIVSMLIGLIRANSQRNV